LEKDRNRNQWKFTIGCSSDGPTVRYHISTDTSKQVRFTFGYRYLFGDGQGRKTLLTSKQIRKYPCGQFMAWDGLVISRQIAAQNVQKLRHG
jgi:hypothetical protein